MEQFKLKVSVQDLMDLDYGTYFDTGIYEVYMNLIRLFYTIS
jgi:hypothetical protein